VQGCRLERGGRCKSMRFCLRDITRSGSAPRGLGYPSTFGWRTASAILKHGSCCLTRNGKRSGLRARTRRAFFRSTPSSSSTALFAFQRMSSNGC
jgi:hypothetical protein